MKETLSSYQVCTYAKCPLPLPSSLWFTWSSKLKNGLVNGGMCSPLELIHFILKGLQWICENRDHVWADTSTSFWFMILITALQGGFYDFYLPQRLVCYKTSSDAQLGRTGWLISNDFRKITALQKWVISAACQWKNKLKSNPGIQRNY